MDVQCTYLHRLGDLPSSADNLLTAMPTVSRADLAVQTVELAEGLDHRAEHGGRWRARMSPVTNRALRWLATYLSQWPGSNYVRR